GSGIRYFQPETTAVSLVDIDNATKNRWLLQRKTKGRVLSIPRIWTEVRLPQHIARKLQAARRIHDKNATHVIIENAKVISAANNACCAVCIDSTAKNTAPMPATPAALAICAVVPYIPEPAPAEAGFTLASTTLDSGAITNPWP